MLQTYNSVDESSESDEQAENDDYEDDYVDNNFEQVDAENVDNSFATFPAPNILALNKYNTGEDGYEQPVCSRHAREDVVQRKVDQIPDQGVHEKKQ